jgi:hypothetical protein
MPYSQFTLTDVRRKLHLQIDELTSLFAPVEAVPASDYLQTTLRRFAPLVLASNTEWIDLDEYYLAQISKIIGILQTMVNVNPVAA